jgi:diacylglycerol kinase (ATP)
VNRAIALIVNPAAGAGRARGAGLRAAAALREGGAMVTVHTTSGPGDAAVLARRAVAQGAAVVAVCGGDGTIHEVARALAGTGRPMGLIPSGRGNDLAAVLRIPKDAAAAARLVVTGEPIRIDLGTANGTPFCTVAAIGLDAEVARRTRAGVWRHAGRAGYVAAGVVTLASFRPPRLRVTGDSVTRAGRYLLCAVSNTGQYGGGVRIAPGSSVDDGLLDCCLVAAIPLWRALRLVPEVVRGTHGRHAEVEMLRARAFGVETDRPLPLMLDGEPAGTTPVRFGVEPGALTVIVQRAPRRMPP